MAFWRAERLFLRRICAFAFALVLATGILAPMLPGAQASCPLEMQQAYAAFQLQSGALDLDVAGVPGVPMQDTSRTCLGDGSGGGGGGGGAIPCTTDCTPNWVPINVNGIATQEIENPLSRFDEFRVDRGDPDRVVALDAVPFTPYMGDVFTPLEALTEGDITSAMLYFGIQDGTGMAQTIQDMLGGNPTFDTVREQAVQLLLNDEFFQAARTLLGTHTAADVLIACGSEANPLQLRWIVAIPISLPCTQGEIPKKIPVLVRARDASYPVDQYLEEKNDEDGLDSVNLTLVVGPATDATQSLVGMMFKRHGVGAYTWTNKPWEVNAFFENMMTIAGNRTHVTFAAGVPGTPTTSTFSSGDVLYYNEKGTLARGTSFGLVLDGAHQGLQMQASRSSTTARDPPNENWDIRLAIAAQDQSKLDHWRGMAEFGNEHAIAYRFARTPQLQLTHWAAPSVADHGTRYFLNMTHIGLQPDDVPTDTIEAWTTLYGKSVANATVRTVGLPALSRYIFDAADEPGDSVASVDVTRDRFGASQTDYFRTVLITGHSPQLPFSATANYTRRAILQGSDTSDPFATTEPPAASSLAQSMDTNLTWAGLWANRTSTTDGKNYVNMSRVSDPEILFYFASGQGAQAALSAPPLAEGELRRVPDAPGPARYVWAMPSGVWSPRVPHCPAMGDGVCL